MSEATDKKFVELAELKPDWDSYGAKPITPVAIAVAKTLLLVIQSKDPWIVPTCHGGVQLEWHFGGRDVELCVTPEGLMEDDDA